MRVLIVKLGAMGDVVMSLSMIPAIRSLDQHASLTWLVGLGSKPVLDLVEGIDRLIVVDETLLLRGSLPQRLRQVAAAWKPLLGESFDLIVTAHRDRRYRLLTAPLRARERRAFSRVGRAGPIPARYHGDEYARLIVGRDDPANRRFGLPELAGTMPAVPFERCARDSIVVLAPGGARNVLRDDPLRRWPLDFYARVARREIERSRRVVIVGGGGDVEARSYFAELPVVDLIGRTSVAELVATLRAANVVVTHDSLALHLARLAGAPIIALFGPTPPFERIPGLPIGAHRSANDIKVLWGGGHLPCRPCYDGVNYAACAVNECMRDISPERVSEAIEEIIRP